MSTAGVSIDGTCKVGANFAVVALHPMKVGATLMSSFLFNVALVRPCMHQIPVRKAAVLQSGLLQCRLHASAQKVPNFAMCSCNCPCPEWGTHALA